MPETQSRVAEFGVPKNVFGFRNFAFRFGVVALFCFGVGRLTTVCFEFGRLTTFCCEVGKLTMFCQNITIYLQMKLDDFLITFSSQKAPEHYHLLTKWNLDDFLITFSPPKAPEHYHLLTKWKFGRFFDHFFVPKSARTLLFTYKMKFSRSKIWIFSPRIIFGSKSKNRSVNRFGILRSPRWSTFRVEGTTALLTNTQTDKQTTQPISEWYVVLKIDALSRKRYIYNKKRTIVMQDSIFTIIAYALRALSNYSNLLSGRLPDLWPLNTLQRLIEWPLLKTNRVLSKPILWRKPRGGPFLATYAAGRRGTRPQLGNCTTWEIQAFNWISVSFDQILMKFGHLGQICTLKGPWGGQIGVLLQEYDKTPKTAKPITPRFAE